MNVQFIVGSIVLAAVCGFGFAADAPDGEWTVDVTPSANNKLKGTNVAYPDVLTIKKGKLSSQSAVKQGFAPGACEVTTDNGKIKISADLVSPKHGKNHYEFEVEKGALSGSMVWSKAGEDGKPKEAEFTLKSKAK